MTEETKPLTEQVTSAISDATQKVTDEAAALFGSAKEALNEAPKSIAEAAPVRLSV